MKHLPAGALVVVIDDGSKPAAAVLDGVLGSLAEEAKYHA